MRKYCKIATTDEGMTKLMDHALARQVEQLAVQSAQQSAQIAELTALLKQQMTVREVVDGAKGTIVHQVVDNSVGKTVNQLVLHQWNAPSGALPVFDAAFLVRVFTCCTELKGYCEMPQIEQMDPDIASPYVARALVETVREAHRDPVYRNVYLNPKRADQVLVCVEAEGKQRWEVRQALEASRDLFDAAVTQMRRTVLSDVERPKMPQKIQDAAAWVPMMYESAPERYVVGTKSQMAALYESSRDPIASYP